MSEDQLVDAETEEEILDDPQAERRMRRLWLLVVVVVLAFAAVLAARYWPEEAAGPREVHRAEAPATPEHAGLSPPGVRFVDVTAAAGLAFRHVNGAAGDKLLPETMGSGAAFFDYDRDGDFDLLLVNSAPWDAARSGGPGPTQAFYENDGKGRFHDVTERVGLDLCIYGMGATVGDYDADGYPDLFVTAVGENHLFRNAGGRRFDDVTADTGVGGGDRWSSSAAFLDYDGDGRLDLFVLNYIVWSPEIDRAQGFRLAGLGRAYGPPTGFAGETCTLFRNTGAGFEDVTEKAGVVVLNRATKQRVAKALGVLVCDYDDDGRPDVVVANDTVRNFAFRNRGDGTFAEEGADVALAFDSMGNARGAMGIAAGDYRNDGSLAVAVGNFANEMTALYVNEDASDPLFFDEATSAGIGARSRNSLTFGVVFFDYDLDGRLDLLAANGHVEPDIGTVQASQRHAQSVDLFWNGGAHERGRMVEVGPEHAGDAMFVPMVGRGLAVADIDGDGDLDVLITANDGPPRLLRNDCEGMNFLRLDLRTADGKRTALGASVRLESEAGPQYRYLATGGSYLSHSEDVLTFGLGHGAHALRVRIRWPSGAEQVIDRLEAGWHLIRQPE